MRAKVGEIITTGSSSLKLPQLVLLTAAPLSARQLIHSKQPPNAFIFNRQKTCLPGPFWLKTLLFWQWSTAHYTCWIAIERLLCQKHSSYYCKFLGFAWKNTNPNSSLTAFSWNINFYLLWDFCGGVCVSALNTFSVSKQLLMSGPKFSCHLNKRRYFFIFFFFFLSDPFFSKKLLDPA